MIVDISALGTTGYRAADWLRAHHGVDLHVSDHRRISAQLTHADNEDTTKALVTALTDLVDHLGDLRPATPVDIPSPEELTLEQVVLPRDAFFGKTEQVPIAEAEGRITAEMLTPYPPGIPVALPGERLNRQVLDYLRTGIEAGMVVPDAADQKVRSLRALRMTHWWRGDSRAQRGSRGRAPAARRFRSAACAVVRGAAFGPARLRCYRRGVRGGAATAASGSHGMRGPYRGPGA